MSDDETRSYWYRLSGVDRKFSLYVSRDSSLEHVADAIAYKWRDRLLGSGADVEIYDSFESSEPLAMFRVEIEVAITVTKA